MWLASHAFSSAFVDASSAPRNGDATRLVYHLVDKSPIAPSYTAIATTLKAIGDDRGARYWAVEGLKKFPKNATLRKLAGS